jgi:hypothetical protein
MIRHDLKGEIKREHIFARFELIRLIIGGVLSSPALYDALLCIFARSFEMGPLEA